MGLGWGLAGLPEAHKGTSYASLGVGIAPGDAKGTNNYIYARFIVASR